MTSPSDDDDRLTIESFQLVVQPEPWTKQAACRGSLHLFYPKPGKSTKKAYELCNSCPVRVECGDYRARTGSVGIWAGEYFEHPTQPQPSTIQDARPRRAT